MKIYIVVYCYGGLVEEVKPFLDENKAKKYEKEIRGDNTFTEGEDTVAVHGEDLPLPAAIQTRIEKHLAEKTERRGTGRIHPPRD